jgi:ATP-dependent Clp protease protease subunit
MFLAKAKSSKVGELYIYEDIGEGWFGGISAKRLTDELKNLGNPDSLDVYINSPGGSVFEGLAIYNALRRYPAQKNVYVDGLAASIASIIMLAGDNVKIAANGMVMIHDPWGFSVGNANEMRTAADTLDKVRDTLVETYVSRTTNDKVTIEKWMSDETWFSANEALANKFVSEVIEEKPIQAHFTLLAKFKNTPEKLKNSSLESRTQIARMGNCLQKIRRTSPPKV